MTTEFCCQQDGVNTTRADSTFYHDVATQTFSGPQEMNIFAGPAPERMLTTENLGTIDPV